MEEQKVDLLLLYCCKVVMFVPCVSAQVQIEGDFLACSFSILEEQPMDMLLGLDMLKRHQVSFETVTVSSKLSDKCNINAMPVNLVGFFWGKLMVDYLPDSYERSTYTTYIMDGYRVSGCSWKCFALIKDAQSFPTE